MIEYYTGTQQECLAIDATITANCSWPAKGTTNWADTVETIDTGVYAIEVPQDTHDFTKAEMNNTITNTPITGVVFPNTD